MSPDDDRRFAETIGALYEFHDKELSQVKLRVWRLALEDLPVESVEQAAVKLLRESPYLPKPNEIREIALSRGVSMQQRIDAAWETLDAALRSNSYDRSLMFSDPVINAAARSLGDLRTMCTTPDREWHTWSKKRFAEAYATYAATPPTPYQCRPLGGQLGGEPLLIESRHEPLPNAPQLEAIAAPKRADVPRLKLKTVDEVA